METFLLQKERINKLNKAKTSKEKTLTKFESTEKRFALFPYLRNKPFLPYLFSSAKYQIYCGRSSNKHNINKILERLLRNYVKHYPYKDIRGPLLLILSEFSLTTHFPKVLGLSIKEIL